MDRELWDEMQTQLRALAASQLRNERPGHTLQATALVNEAYLRMVDRGVTRIAFAAAAANVMRQVLVDHARKKKADKRGAGAVGTTLSGLGISEEHDEAGILDVHEAVEELTALDEREGRIVELRFFGGLAREEVAEAMGISVSLVDQEWAHARVWLSARLAAHRQG